MKTLRCLYFEHEDDHYSLHTRILKDAFKNWAELAFDQARTPDEAYTKVKDRAAELNILFVDWYFDHEKKDLGVRPIKAIEQAAAQKTIAVIGITNAEVDKVGPEFRSVGGDWIVGKTKIQEMRPEDLRKEINEAMTRHGSQIYAFDMHWAPRPSLLRLQAEIDTVGRDVLENLVMMLLPPEATGATGFTPRFVARGRSGAVVIRADVEGEKWPGKYSLFVKASKDRDKLEEEIANAKGPPQLPSLYVPYLDGLSEPRQSGQWYAIASVFDAKSTTLHDWIASADQPPKPEAIERLMNGLFTAGLKEQEYRYSRPAPDETAYEVLKMKPSQCARVLGALGELRRPLERLKPPVDVGDLFPFIANGAIGRKPASDLPTGQELASGVHRCLCHGDLHSRNIMVSTDGRPRLIDAAHRGYHHWARDPARLCADLWIIVWDRGQAYYWNREGEPPTANVSRWRNALVDWVTGRGPAAEEAAKDPVLTALNVLRGMLPRVFEDRWDVWQFRLALLTEFLAHGSYEDVPAPKRCLSLAVAKDLIGLLEESFPQTGAGTDQ